MCRQHRVNVNRGEPCVGSTGLIVVLCMCVCVFVQAYSVCVYVCLCRRIQLLESELVVLNDWQVKRDYNRK